MGKNKRSRKENERWTRWSWTKERRRRTKKERSWLVIVLYLRNKITCLFIEEKTKKPADDESDADDTKSPHADDEL
jgi:hypothetical protein